MKDLCQHGSPFQVATIDVSNLDVHNPQYCYTEEEAKARYGPDEGKVTGEDVIVCGRKLPKAEAIKFATQYGTISCNTQRLWHELLLAAA
jgi:hypothetical protein